MSKYRDLNLNQLKTELRNAYVKKALENQMREKEAEREMEKNRENYSIKLEKLKDLEFKDHMKKQKAETEQKREIYKKELEDQIEGKELVKKVEAEKAINERKCLEEADRTVDERILAEKLRTRKELAERLQREKRIFQEIKAIRKRTELKAEEEETKKREKYLEEMEERSKELEALHREQTTRRENLINKVAKMLVNSESKKLDRESKIAELMAEEMAWEFVIQEREDELRKKRMRDKLAEDLKEQMLFRDECARRSIQRDKDFAETVMIRIMEEEKIDRLTNDAKIRNRILYRDDLIRLMDERKTIRRLEQERIKIEFEREKEMEEMRINEICEARRNLLMEHARYVAPYVKDNSMTEKEKIIVANALKK